MDQRISGKFLLRLSMLGAILVGALAAVYFSPIRMWLADTGRVKSALDFLGIWAYPACVFTVAILVAAGLPRLVLCAIGGMVFGFWIGLLLTYVGTLLGYYGIFLFVRWGGRDLVLHRWPRLRKWADLIQDQGITGVILIRQVPIHGMLTNLCLGLSRLKHRHFLIGPAIGVLPESIPVA